MTTSDELVNLTDEQLAAALRAGADGTLTDEAAIELLIEQESWLRNKEFRRRFIDYTTEHTTTGGPPVAWIKWTDAITVLDEEGLPMFGGAADRILRIAASLGGGVPVSLRDTATNSLGRAHAGMVCKAIVRSTGIIDHPQIITSWVAR